MPKKRIGPPPYYARPHASGQAYTTWTEAGRQRTEYFGVFGSPESHAAYKGFVKRWLEAHATIYPAADPRPGCLVLSLIDAFLTHAEGYYVRPDGSPTTEVAEFRRTFAVLVHVAGRLGVNDIRPRHFTEARQQMIEAGLSLGVINQRMGRIRRLFWWGVAEGLLEPAIAQALSAVRDLAAGRCQAPETDPVEAVAWELVEATLPHLASDQLRAIVRFQWHSGCRPGEACTVRGADLFTEGPVPVGSKWLQLRPGTWAYRVRAKMAHARSTSWQVYALGPQARETLSPWLRENPEEYLWQPREAQAARYRAMRARRQSTVQPSQVSRARKAPRRTPGLCYQVTSYAHAIATACLKAGLPHWHPHQIRHAAEQRVEKLYGLEGGRKVLGHTSISTTLGYSQRDLDGAAEIAEVLG